MIVPDDYSPVVEEGELEAGSGLRTRLRRRQELAPLGSGFQRVLLAEDGTPLVSDKQLTPGEKRYTRARSWIRIDVGHHRLDYRVPFSDPSGRADFVATVAVDVVVGDAVEAVRQRATSVKDSLEPALRRAVADVGESGDAVGEDNRIVALTVMRQGARSRIRTLERQALSGLPSWLTATIMSTAVEFDDATKRHYDQLVELGQEGQLIEATAENREKRTKGELTVRKLWREDLLPHLSDPSRRVFEQVFANPTDENIAIAVDQANQREMVLLQEVVRSFEMAAREGFVDKDDPTIRALVGFVGRLPEMVSGSGAALTAGTQNAAGDTDAEPPVDAEADAETEVNPPPETEPGDRDFSD